MRIPYEDYQPLADEALKLLDRKSLFVKFDQEDLLQTGIYYMPTEGNILFVPESSMHLFEPYKENILRFLKIHNYGKPAIVIRFNLKHKYVTRRHVAKNKVAEIIMQELADQKEWFHENSESLNPDDTEEMQLLESLQKKYEENVRLLEGYLNDLDSYEFTLSNYFKNFTYYQANIRYLESGKTASMEQHVAKTKTNIIFISEELSQKHKEHKHKKIEKYLNTLEPVLSGNLTDLFAKKIQR